MPQSAAFPAAVHHSVGKRQLRSVISSLPWQLAFSPLHMPGAAPHSWWAAWGQGPHATHLTPQPPPRRVGAPGAGAVGSVPLSLPLVGVPGPRAPSSPGQELLGKLGCAGTTLVIPSQSCGWDVPAAAPQHPPKPRRSLGKKSIRQTNLAVAEGAEFISKASCKLINCFCLSSDLIISTGRLLTRVSNLWFLGGYVRK